MRNQYPGFCYRCQKWCLAGEGHFERLGNAWRVQHATCAIEFRGTPDADREAQRLRSMKYRATLSGPKGQRARKALRDMAGVTPGSVYVLSANSDLSGRKE